MNLRRFSFNNLFPVEKAIYSAKINVEQLPADPILTEAVTRLTQAGNLVSDFIDNKLSQGLNFGTIEDLSKSVGVICYSFKDFEEWVENNKHKYGLIRSIQSVEDLNGYLFDKIIETEVGNFNRHYAEILKYSTTHLKKQC